MNIPPRLSALPAAAARGAAACLAAALFAAAGAGAAGAADRRGALLDGGRDEIVRRAFVPSAEDPHGEVRLVRRGDAAVMQTVLASRVLKRVVGEIRKKENAIWPPGSEGRADSARYVAALSKAREEVERRFRQKGATARGDRRRCLMIEFVLSRDASFVLLSEPEVVEGDEGFRVVGNRGIQALDLSRLYVRGNLRAIAMDALGMSRKEADRTLKPLLPPDPRTDDAPAIRGE